jgi:hypothetical protein
MPSHILLGDELSILGHQMRFSVGMKNGPLSRVPLKTPFCTDFSRARAIAERNTYQGGHRSSRCDGAKMPPLDTTGFVLGQSGVRKQCDHHRSLDLAWTRAVCEGRGSDELVQDACWHFIVIARRRIYSKAKEESRGKRDGNFVQP